ncbi:MAG TPA: glycerophosphodiester phosphodiesterase [Bacillus bacterium]|uniref:Glycerophosphoryl diester phosphodiesterase n=1 Tax=Siminovitchia fordii TaxID=254759 RepID=A0ABQ4K4R7_9BACI|nr:glycerophosphodiester phosphodiesterase [Siminovitchia fordii]GIN19941.1 glycerophosphoryl diester phosphodiesterase [Siminovitchia fordii]HBZ08575.1 glycerophosphodiester phosphodiesterase [Bacillus sp. (in: firmicutes)]
MTFIFAHRGSAGTHPENTMEAFVAAEIDGADGIELDVQLTADGEIAVIHDLTVDRTTNGSGYVNELTYSELSKLKANYHSLHFFKKSCRIPSLREVFEWLEANDLLCNIELKNAVNPYRGMEEKVVELVHEYCLERRVLISSFNHKSLVHCKEIAPAIITAPLYNEVLYKPWEYAASLGASGIHPKLKSISDREIIDTMACGIAVRPYTVNKEKDMKRLFAIDCSAIITDYPGKAYRLREQYQ